MQKSKTVWVTPSTTNTLSSDSCSLRKSERKLVNTHIPESPIWCPKMVEYRWVTLREYPPKGLSGSRVRVIATEVLTGPESSSACGDWVDTRACPLVIVLSGVVVSFVRCFNVSFSDTHKSKSLNRSRKVFQSFRKWNREKSVSSLKVLPWPSRSHHTVGTPGSESIIYNNRDNKAISLLHCHNSVVFQTTLISITENMNSSLACDIK